MTEMELSSRLYGGHRNNIPPSFRRPIKIQRGYQGDIETREEPRSDFFILSKGNKKIYDSIKESLEKDYNSSKIREKPHITMKHVEKEETAYYVHDKDERKPRVQEIVLRELGYIVAVRNMESNHPLRKKLLELINECELK